MPSVMPQGLPQVPKARIDGVDLPMSRLVIGCDNKNNIGAGAVVWDAWAEAGGNAFDTGFVYGGGAHEAVLGQWIAKGAHSPYCTPRSIGAQLEISLSRLGLDFVPIYIMHRDNPAVPVSC